MSSVRDFLRWFNNQDIESTLKAMQKLITFHHDEDVD